MPESPYNKIAAELHSLIADAIGEMTRNNDWARASRLVVLGQRLHSIGASELDTAALPQDAQKYDEPGPPVRKTVPADTSVRPNQAEKKPLKGTYPNFQRENTSLVKIGWSKSQKSVYEHKCPRAVVDELTAACLRVDGRFTMEKILPLRATAVGEVLPDYQAYVALAWLRHLGLVTQHGRSGYSIPKASGLSAAVASSWDRLQTR